MFFGLFKSKNEKLKEEIKKKYKRDDSLWEIQRLRNSNEDFRKKDDNDILTYILLYGFMQQESDSSISHCSSVSSNTQVESNIIQPTQVSETSDYSSSCSCTSHRESNSSSDYTPSYSSSGSYSSSSDSSSSSSCD